MERAASEKRALEARLADTEKSISNLVKVIESGLINEDIKNRVQELEKEKSEIKIALAEAELNKDVSLMRSGILYLQTAKMPG